MACVTKDIKLNIPEQDVITYKLKYNEIRKYQALQLTRITINDLFGGNKVYQTETRLCRCQLYVGHDCQSTPNIPHDYHMQVGLSVVYRGVGMGRFSEKFTKNHQDNE